MLLIHGSEGGIGWGKTSTFFKNNYIEFLKIRSRNRPPGDGTWKDFGAGSEPTFVCGNCRRGLPVTLSEVDHQTAKTLLIPIVSQRKGAIVKSGFSYTFPKTGTVETVDVTLGHIQRRNYKIEGTIFKLAKGTTTSPNRDVYFPTGSSLHNVCKNDVDNLQLLCSYCNRSKGAR